MTLSNLITLLDEYLGAKNIYKADVKTTALNQSRKYLLMNYDIMEMIRTVDIVFTSGKASIPSNYLRSLKLFDTTTGEYWNRLNENDFDLNKAKSYTIKWDETSSTYKFFIYTAESRTLKLRYVYFPSDMTILADTDSGLQPWWDDAQACYASYLVLQKDRQPEAAPKFSLAKEHIRTALKNQYGDQKESNDFHSIYDNEYSLLGSESSFYG